MSHGRSVRGMTRVDLAIWVVMVAACSAMIIWSWVRFAPDRASEAGSGGAQASGEEAPVQVQAPRLELTDQHGRTFDSRTMLGKVWVVDFIFTNCPGPCPIMTGNLRTLQQAIGPDDRFHLVSITCDPWRDDPATLKRYAESYGADQAQWTFLTGAFPEIQRYARELFLTAENPRQAAEAASQPIEGPDQAGTPAGHEGPIVHSSRIVLVGEDGRVYDWYFGTEAQDMQRLIADVRMLIKEPHPSRSAAALRLLPTVNASLNGVAAMLLLVGWRLIRRGYRSAHQRVMIAAFLTSVVFLVCYVTYHSLRQAEEGVGHTRWEVDGAIRWVYYAILISHVVLAAAVPFLAIRTLWLATAARFDAHRRLARITWPIWMYVSVTGVIVYAMLYHIQPMLAAG